MKGNKGKPERIAVRHEAMTVAGEPMSVAGEPTVYYTITDKKTCIWIGETLPLLAQTVSAAARRGLRVGYCSDSRIWPQVLPLLRECGLRPGDGAPTVCFEPGEAHKQMAQVTQGWEALLRAGFDRQAMLLNVGGGVVGDMGGFMAATYKRGIPFVQVPTSLLAMVDASVGGKTGVDVGEIKNMAGLFVRPEAVYINPRFLRTLPIEEYYSGVAEMIKMKLLFHAEVDLKALEAMFDPARLPLEAIVEAVEDKKRIVTVDFNEVGPRRLLNFGHTFGHAFEALYMVKGEPVPHGRAVAWGIVYELYMSVLRRNFDADLFRRIRDLLTHYYGRPLYGSADGAALAGYLRQDKKNVAGDIRPILMTMPGGGDYMVKVPLSAAMEILEHGDAVYSF